MRLIEKDSELSALVEELKGARRFFVDTEFESVRGGTTLSLIQIHDGKEVHLVDGLRLPSLTALGPALSGDEREWVLHAGQQDVPLLMDHLGLKELPRLLDTQVAWACCSPEASVSLAYLEMVLLGKRRGKGHQADDWKRRPLPKSQLTYAAEDVASLPTLFEQLERRLKKNDRLEIAYQASRELLLPEAEPPRRLRLADFRNAWQLGPGQQAALLHLIDWYGKLPPKSRQRAPETKTLLSIAARLPRNARDLGRIKGVSQRFAEREGAQLCAALQRAADAAETESFESIAPPPYTTFEEIRREGWLARARAELCAELQVAPELLLPARVSKSLKAEWDDSDSLESALESLRGFRRQLLAPALRQYAAAHPPPTA